MTRLALAAGLAVLLVAPAWLPPYPRYVFALCLVYAVAAIGLNFCIGLAGIYSLGHGAFMLVGAYVTVIANTKWGWPLLPAGLLSVVAAAAVAFLIAFPALRLRGLALAIATFAFSLMMFEGVKSLDYAGGPSGLLLPRSDFSRAWGGVLPCYACAVIFLATAAMAWSIAAGKTGWALRVMGTSETVASALGIDVRRYRMTAFLLSAAYAAMAGSLLAIVTNDVAPEIFAPELSINLFAAVIIGGSGTLFGPVLGAAFIVLIPELTQVTRELGDIIYAVAFLLVSILFPRGLVRLFAGGLSRLMPASRAAP